MEFLKEVLGEKYEEFKGIIDTYNENPENKDKKIKLVNLESGGYVSSEKYVTLKTEKEGIEGQLQTAQEKLNELEDLEGIDVDDMRTKISTLKTDIETQKRSYEKEIADLKFDHVLESALRKKKAKNAKAAIALLDVDALKQSNNQEADINAAIEKVKEENDFLFDEEDGDGKKENPTVVLPTGKKQKTGKKMSLSEAMKYANEHPEVDISTLI